MTYFERKNATTLKISSFSRKKLKNQIRSSISPLALVFLFFAYGSRLVADLILKKSVFHLFIDAKINLKLFTLDADDH